MRFKEFYLTEMPTQKLYHATYKPLLDNIKKKGLGNTKRKNWNDSEAGCVYLAIDKEVAISYAETTDMVPEEYLEQIVCLWVYVKDLDSNKLIKDPNVRNEDNDTFKYCSIIPWNVLHEV